MSQAAALMGQSPRRTVPQALRAGVAIGWLDAAESTALKADYALFWQVQVAAKLLNEQDLSPETIGEGGAAFLLRETGAESMAALETALAEAATRAAGHIDAALGRAATKD